MNEDRFLCIISWTWVIDLSMEWTTLNVTFYIHECERIKLKSVCRVKEDCFGAFHISLSYIIRENSFKLNLNYKYINFFQFHTYQAEAYSCAFGRSTQIKFMF